MKRDIENKVKEINSRHVRKNTWQRIVSVLCCIVVFVTTYALILPAFTLEKTSPDTYCGYEAHKHTDECYEKVLVCTQDQNDENHEHTEECYEKRLICSREEHTHTSECLKDPEQSEASEYESGIYLMGDDSVLAQISCGYAKYAPLSLEKEEYKDKTIYVKQSEKDRTVFFTDENTQKFTLKNKNEEGKENSEEGESQNETELKEYKGDIFALEASENEAQASVTVSKNAKAGDAVILQGESQNGEESRTTEIRVVCDATVTYDLNGGQNANGESQIDDINGKTYETYALADAPEKDGMFFTGWQAQDKSVYAAGAPYTVGAEKEQTLTAKWSLTKVSINGLPDGVTPDVEQKDYTSDILGIEKDGSKIVAYQINAQDENGEDVKYFDGESVDIRVEDFDLKEGEKLCVYHLLDSTEAIKKAYDNNTLCLKRVEGLEKIYPQEAKACAEFLNEVNYSGENGIAAGQTDVLAYTVINTANGEVLSNSDGSVAFSSDSLSSFIFMVETSANTNLESTGAVIDNQAVYAPTNFTNDNIISWQNATESISSGGKTNNKLTGNPFLSGAVPSNYNFALGGNMSNKKVGPAGSGKDIEYPTQVTRTDKNGKTTITDLRCHVYDGLTEINTTSELYGWKKSYFVAQKKEGYIEDKILYPMPGEKTSHNNVFQSDKTYGAGDLYCRYNKVGKYVDPTGSILNIDVKLSVVAYGKNTDEPKNSSIYEQKDGTKPFNPLIFFRTDKIGVYVLGVSYVTLQYTFYKSGTNNSIPVSGFTTYNDIDGYQGVFLHNNVQKLLCNPANLNKLSGCQSNSVSPGINNSVCASKVNSKYWYIYDGFHCAYEDYNGVNYSNYAAFTECFTSTGGSITRTFTFYDKKTKQARGTIYNSNNAATSFDYGLILEKQMKAGESFPTNGFQFKITVFKKDTNGNKKPVTNTKFGDITTNGNGVAEKWLKKGEVITLRNLTTENVVKVEELTPGYTTSAAFKNANNTTAAHEDNIYNFNIGNANVIPNTRVVYAVITNTEKYTLKIDKTLFGSNGNTDTFKFAVEVQDENGNAVTGNYGDVELAKKVIDNSDGTTKTVGYAEFKLTGYEYGYKDPVPVVVDGLRRNWKVTVRELDSKDYIIVKNKVSGDTRYVEGKEREIVISDKIAPLTEDSETSHVIQVHFLNSKTENKGEKKLALRKWVLNGVNSDNEFTFEIVQYYYGTNSIMKKEEVTLKGGEIKYINIELDDGDYMVKITEKSNSDYKCYWGYGDNIIKWSDRDSITLISDRDTLFDPFGLGYVTVCCRNTYVPPANEEGYYGIVVSKELVGDVDPNKKFHFAIDLYKDTKDTPADAGTYDGYSFETKTIYTDTRKEVDENNTDANAETATVTRYEFYLKPNESFIIRNLPGGYKAFVREFADGYYTQVKTNDGEYEVRVSRYLTLTDKYTDADRYLRLYYRNSTSKELPATGGIGVYPFIIVGGVIMLSAVICAVVLLLKQKRNNKK